MLVHPQNHFFSLDLPFFLGLGGIFMKSTITHASLAFRETALFVITADGKAEKDQPAVDAFSQGQGGQASRVRRIVVP